MVTEAELPAQLGRVVGIVPDVGVMPDVVSPTLEMVTFSGARLEPLCGRSQFPSSRGRNAHGRWLRQHDPGFFPGLARTRDNHR
jgi:hypothetical protein